MRDIKRVLITGITGFVGSHLADYILKYHPEVEIFGLVRWRSPMDNVAHIPEGAVQYLWGDLTDTISLTKVLKESNPDVIFHLAAQSQVDASYIYPVKTIDDNVKGTLNLLETIRILSINPIVHICSSSEVYGQVSSEDVPIKESCSLRPASPYAVSKVGEDMLGYMYYTAYGLRTIRTRMFTHTGQRRAHRFFLPAFARQIARIEKGVQEPTVYVGNLNSVRTVLDVHDAVKAYWLLVNKCEYGEVYNIGGETTATVGEYLQRLLQLSTRLDIKVQVSDKYLRPADVTLQIPCISKFKQKTNWKAVVPVEDTLKSILDYWRMRV